MTHMSKPPRRYTLLRGLSGAGIDKGAGHAHLDVLPLGRLSVDGDLGSAARELGQDLLTLVIDSHPPAGPLDLDNLAGVYLGNLFRPLVVFDDEGPRRLFLGPVVLIEIPEVVIGAGNAPMDFLGIARRHAVGTKRRVAARRLGHMGHGLDFLGQEPVHEQLCRVWMGRILQNVDAAFGPTRFQLAALPWKFHHLYGEFALELPEHIADVPLIPFEGPAATDDPTLLQPRITGKQDVHFGEIFLDPFGTGVGREIHFQHAAEAPGVAPGLVRHLSYPLRVKEIPGRFQRSDVFLGEFFGVVPKPPRIVGPGGVDKYRLGAFSVHVPMAI